MSAQIKPHNSVKIIWGICAVLAMGTILSVLIVVIFEPQRNDSVGSLIALLMIIAILLVIGVLSLVRRSLMDVECLGSIVKHSSGFIGITDIEGRPLFINDAGRNLVGIKNDKHLLVTTLQDYFADAEREVMISEIIPTVLNAGRWFGKIDFCNLVNGEKTAVWLDVFRIDNPRTAKLVSIAIVGHELPSHKSAKKLVASETQLEKAQNLSQIGHWGLNPVTDEVYGSDELFRIFNLSGDETTLDSFLKVVHPDDREMDAKAIRRGAKYGESWDIEHRLICRDGKEKWVHAIGEAITDNQGNVVELLGTVQDITEQKQVELDLADIRDHLEDLVEERTRSLIIARDEAEHANATKSKFLSHMSHELRTPLNAILGFGQMLELDSAGFNEIQRGNIKEIVDAGSHLLTLINDVLDVAKIKSGKLPVSIGDIQIDQLLQQCIRLIMPQAKMRHIEIIDNITGRGHTMQADFTRLKQVLLNILSNAVKYNTDRGRITLQCETTSKQCLRIIVVDTGPGLTEEEIAKLFIPFERLDVVNDVEGTGIGLTISKHLVELMGGTIGVISEPGKGSRFWLELALSSCAYGGKVNVQT